MIGPFNDLTLVPTGNQWRTRQAKLHALYVVVRTGHPGSRPTGYFVPTTAWTPIESRFSSLEVRRRYGLKRPYVSWRDGLSDACRAMFDLNHSVKTQWYLWDRGSSVYELKNRLIRLLYFAGYCTEVFVHLKVNPAKPCWSCSGGSSCSKCGGTGIYLPEATTEYLCFTFIVDGQRYVWHQPRLCVRFAVTVTTPSTNWIPNTPNTHTYSKLREDEIDEAEGVVREVIELADRDTLTSVLNPTVEPIGV